MPDKKPPTVEEIYQELVALGFVVTASPNDSKSLRQPSQYKSVETFVTYGAYEEPV